MNPKKIDEIKQYVEQRLNAVLPWYRDCVVCDKTLVNVQSDIDSILRETEKKFEISPLPFYLSARFDHDILVVDAKDRKVN